MRLALVRYRGGKSQNEMASKFGVSQQTWSFWESGKSTPTIQKMKRLEVASGVSMEVLFPDVFSNAVASV